MTYADFFHAATGNAPYDYQSRLAGSDAGRACESQLIAIPTGLGKTAAVVLAWLWNRVAKPNTTRRDAWPRRLVYCLPMRTLVEQTEAEVKKWIAELLKHADELGLSEAARADLRWLAEHSPVILMGGEDAADWDLHPERPAILIGTQDMLLSRALNRGYGMSRYRWPIHFALLNQDALWVLDETQLIGVGIETSSQLDAFRRDFTATCAAHTNAPRAFTWWMSATLSESRLETVDQPRPLALPRTILAESDAKAVAQRFTAPKPISEAGPKLTSASEKDIPAYAKQVAELLLGRQPRHHPGTFTLVVVNNVARAQAVYQALLARGYTSDRLALIHSRFRPLDRVKHQQLLFATGERIVVATQAIEAGVDVSARLLVTELAPWSSLVQRFGRCNRTGNIDDAEVLWIDLAGDEQLMRPYTVAECSAARAALRANLSDVSARSLSQVSAPPEPRVIRPVLRRKDLVDLFDTTPDLTGNDLDVSRYIRDGDDTDVQVYWRDLGDQPPSAKESSPTRNELCSVSLPRFASFFDKLNKKKEFTLFTWDPLEEQWARVRRPRAGGVYLLDSRAGGYSAAVGWTGEPADANNAVTAIPPTSGSAQESNATDRGAAAAGWITIPEHTRHVVDMFTGIATALALPSATTATITVAAQWHDLGKAHAIFAEALRASPGTPPPDASAFYAKSPNRAQPYDRPGFRHELASALAILLAAPADLPERDLVAYLAAAHHGKVRLSIRSLPGETPPPEQPAARCARGIVDGDIIPAAAFAALGLVSADLALDLGFMELGEGTHGASWLARALALRDRIGPFQLAYLEALLRAADMRASAAESQAI
jgi:CRISPR-associated endonuclease/helicase Cas3